MTTQEESLFPYVREVAEKWNLAPVRSANRKELLEMWIDRCKYALKSVVTAPEAHDLYKLCPKGSPVRRRAFRKFLSRLSSLYDFDYYGLLAGRDSFKPRAWANDIRRRYEEVCATEFAWAQTAYEVGDVVWALERLGNPAELQQAALEKLEALCLAELAEAESIEEVKDLACLTRSLPEGNTAKDQIRSRWEAMCLAELEQSSTPQALHRLLNKSPWGWWSPEPNPISDKLETVCRGAIDRAELDGDEFSYIYYPRSMQTRVMLSLVARSTSPGVLRRILSRASRMSKVVAAANRKLAEMVA